MKKKFLMLFIALGTMAVQVEAQNWLKKMKQVLIDGANQSQTKNKGQTDNGVSFKGKLPTDENNSTANSDDEVTLVVSADGATKDEATKTALRSAIEQVYGTFVSANTTILNDELVKDEIVTVASGNIKNYREIVSNVTLDGKTFVTLQATVSISRLVSYAQNKGAETEFAGAAFAMNIKMKELNKQNEMKAWQNLETQVLEMYKHAFTYQLRVYGPVMVTEYESKDDFERTGLPGKPEDYYLINFRIFVKPTRMIGSIYDLVVNTVMSLELTNKERYEYEKMKIPTEYLRLEKLVSKVETELYKKLRQKDNDFESRVREFRSSYPKSSINLEIAKMLCNFEIVDNMENVSYVDWKYVKSSSYICPVKGYNLFACISKLNTRLYYKIVPRYDYWNKSGRVPLINLGHNEKEIDGDAFFLISLPVFIHRNDIGKYSKFEIRERTNPIVFFKD